MNEVIGMVEEEDDGLVVGDGSASGVSSGGAIVGDESNVGCPLRS